MIQPGGLVQSSVGSCTLNFVFRDGAGRLYIGTAGHCTKGSGERMIAGDGNRFGTVVYSKNAGNDDFALIQIDPDKYGSVNPAVRTWGGPTGYTTSSETSLGDRLLLYGYGLGFSLTATTRPRQGILVSDDANKYEADTLAVQGDSGGPFLHMATGKALGIVSHFAVGYTDQGPTVERVLALSAAAGFTLSLVTAPLN